MDNILKQKTISFKDENGDKQYNKIIKLTKNGESKTYYRNTPGESDYSIKDIKSYIKYKGEHYA